MSPPFVLNRTWSCSLCGTGRLCVAECSVYQPWWLKWEWGWAVYDQLNFKLAVKISLCGTIMVLNSDCSFSFSPPPPHNSSAPLPLSTESAMNVLIQNRRDDAACFLVKKKKKKKVGRHSHIQWILLAITGKARGHASVENHKGWFI